MPDEAKEALCAFGELIELKTHGITYEAISGHPDIFFFSCSSALIAAPNLPKEYFRILEEKSAVCVKGNSPVGMKYPETARYNAAQSGSFLIHRTDITDSQVLFHTKEKETIHVAQGYCRCSLLPLKEDGFITSDEGIYKALKARGLNVLYVLPDEIILPGLSHGFFGGACGSWNDKVFLAGSLKYHSQGGEIKNFLQAMDYEIVELYDGPLFDSGSIIFLETDGVKNNG